MAHVDCKMAHETRKEANGTIEMSCKQHVLMQYFRSLLRLLAGSKTLERIF
jgi:hypothetical protein